MDAERTLIVPPEESASYTAEEREDYFLRTPDGGRFLGFSREECEELKKRWDAHDDLLLILKSFLTATDEDNTRQAVMIVRDMAESVLAELDER